MVYLNDILDVACGVKIKALITGSELLLVYEIDKYLKTMYNETLSIKDVKVHKTLFKGKDFSFVACSGVDLGVKIDMTKLTNFSDTRDLYFEDNIQGVDIEEKTDDYWVYRFESDTSKNSKLHRYNKAAAYVSLIAFMIVTSYMDSIKCPKLIISHEKHSQTELEYSHLLILKDWGNCILKNLLDIKYSTTKDLQPDWEAFVAVHRQKGYMDKEYSMAEKYKAAKNFEVGDVVLLYSKQKLKNNSGASIGRLKSCYPAVIREITKSGITFESYTQVDTYLTRAMTLNQLESERDDLNLEVEDYERFLSPVSYIDYLSLGVNLYTYNELRFFIKPIDNDGSEQYFKNSEGTKKYWLSTLDTIYAVFEDRGVEYNKDKFLETYFKTRVPFYDTIRNM